MLCVIHPLPGSSVSRNFQRLKKAEASETFHLQLAGNTTRLNLILFRETANKDWHYKGARQIKRGRRAAMCYSEESYKHQRVGDDSSVNWISLFPSVQRSVLGEWKTGNHTGSGKNMKIQPFTHGQIPLLSQSKHRTGALDHLINTDACCKLSLSPALLPRKNILIAFIDSSERRLSTTYCGSKKKRKHSNSYLECFNNMFPPNPLPAEKQVPEWFS